MEEIVLRNRFDEYPLSADKDVIIRAETLWKNITALQKFVISLVETFPWNKIEELSLFSWLSKPTIKTCVDYWLVLKFRKRLYPKTKENLKLIEEYGK